MEVQIVIVIPFDFLSLRPIHLHLHNIAISLAARSFPAQLVCRKESLRQLKAVTESIHKHDALACIQVSYILFQCP